MSGRVTQIVVVGARGRMGTTLLREVIDSEDFTLAGAVDRSGGPGLGQDAGTLVGRPQVGVTVGEELVAPRGAVVVDFSLPEATDNNIRLCVEQGVALVLGTTGITATTRSLLRQAGAQIPIVSAANFSVGVTLLLRLASVAARALGPAWDAEILELHHSHKRDAPSGTALRLAKAVTDATDRELETSAKFNRGSADEPRRPGEVGVMALRGGDSTGEHTLMLLGEGERLELTHRSRDRAIFARGALRAAGWLADQQVGLYGMAEVLGL